MWIGNSERRNKRCFKNMDIDKVLCNGGLIKKLCEIVCRTNRSSSTFIWKKFSLGKDRYIRKTTSWKAY